MKKITILALHLDYGGIEKSISALANALCDKYKIEIVCIYKLYDKAAFFLEDKIKVKYLIKYYESSIINNLVFVIIYIH